MSCKYFQKHSHFDLHLQHLNERNFAQNKFQEIFVRRVIFQNFAKCKIRDFAGKYLEDLLSEV
jgi:hypothetical protein